MLLNSYLDVAYLIARSIELTPDDMAILLFLYAIAQNWYTLPVFREPLKWVKRL